MKITAVISARWGSTRLPGKALAKIGDKTLLDHIISRLQTSSLINEIVVATTPSSQPIVEHCKKWSIPCFVQSHPFVVDEEDVLRRLVQCGDKFNMELVVRVWGDCPFIDVKLIEEAIGRFWKGRYSCYYPENIAKGLGFMIYNHLDFTKMYHLMSEGDRWYWNLVDEQKGWERNGFTMMVHDYKMTQNIKGMTIDDASDLSSANEIVSLFGDNVTYEELLKWKLK